jgi:hypothetical protein
MNILQCRGDVEHASACGAKHVPRQLENAELSRMQESTDGALFVESVRGREGQHIDADKLAVRPGRDEALDGCRGPIIGRLAQRCE